MSLLGRFQPTNISCVCKIVSVFYFSFARFSFWLFSFIRFVPEYATSDHMELSGLVTISEGDTFMRQCAVLCYVLICAKNLLNCRK